jgi:hypothetical protein
LKELLGGPLYWRADYSRLLMLITREGEVEYSLRRFYLSIVEKKFKYNVKTGENNLEELTDELIRVTNNWLEDVFEDEELAKKFNDHIKWKLGDKPQRFVVSLFALIIMIILSNIALKRIGAENFEKRNKIIETVTNIYYGHSLAKEQFEALWKAKYMGGILFRGKKYTLEKAIALVNENKLGKGSSWTENYNKAKQLTDCRKWDDAKKINSFKEFVEEYKRKCNQEHYVGSFIFIDKISVLKSALKMLMEIEQLWEGVSVPDRQSVNIIHVHIILSHLAVHESGVYIGDKGAFTGGCNLEDEVILKPENFKLSDNAIDAVIWF